MTTAQLAAKRLNLNEARCEALFASRLQPSDGPTADMVAEAINYTVQQVGISGCVGQMAQEFGDHPDAAAERMRWVRQFDPESRPEGHHAYQATDAEDERDM